MVLLASNKGLFLLRCATDSSLADPCPGGSRRRCGRRHCGALTCFDVNSGDEVDLVSTWYWLDLPTMQHVCPVTCLMNERADYVHIVGRSRYVLVKI